MYHRLQHCPFAAAPAVVASAPNTLEIDDVVIVAAVNAIEVVKGVNDVPDVPDVLIVWDVNGCDENPKEGGNAMAASKLNPPAGAAAGAVAASVALIAVKLHYL